MTQKHVTEQLKTATNPSSTPEELKALWMGSKSPRVRKAVARNPNADGAVLRSAARLYLEEVLENPSFQLLDMFGDDSWIRDISNTLNDPDSFIRSNPRKFRISYSYINTTDADKYCWACLLSPNLSVYSLNAVFATISAKTLKRAVKNQKIIENIKRVSEDIINSNGTCGELNLESIFKLHKEKLISLSAVNKAIKIGFVSNSMVCPRRTFSSFYSHVVSEYIYEWDINNRKEMEEIILQLLVKCRWHMVKWLPVGYYGIGSKSGKTSLTYRDGCKAIGEMFINIYKKMKSINNFEKSMGSKVGFIRDNISTYISSYFLDQTGHSRYDWVRGLTLEEIEDRLKNLFEYIKGNGLEDINLISSTIGLSTKETQEALVKSKNFEMKEFYLLRGLFGLWASYNINGPAITLAEEVNDYIYSKEGISPNLIFNFCSTQKIVHLNREHLSSDLTSS